MNMKTESCEIQRNLNRDLPQVNRLANVTDSRATSSLRNFSAACQTKLNQLKERLTEQFAVQYGNSISPMHLKLAVQEADSLAATTSFPSLFLPTLAEEKVQLAYAWSIRQRQIREQSSLAFAE